jgi:hypothetical protein
MEVEGKSSVWQFTTWEAEGGYGLDSFHILRADVSTSRSLLLTEVGYPYSSQVL